MLQGRRALVTKHLWHMPVPVARRSGCSSTYACKWGAFAEASVEGQGCSDNPSPLGCLELCSIPGNGQQWWSHCVSCSSARLQWQPPHLGAHQHPSPAGNASTEKHRATLDIYNMHACKLTTSLLIDWQATIQQSLQVCQTAAHEAAQAATCL